MADTDLLSHSTSMAQSVGLAHAELVKLRAAGLPAKFSAGLAALESHLNAISESNISLGDVARQEQEVAQQEQQAAASERRSKALPA